MSRWVWCISIFLLLCIGGAIGVGWYFTHNKPADLPLAVGGSANESQVSTSRPTATDGGSNTSRVLVAPTAVETKRALPEYEYLKNRDNGSAAHLARRTNLHARHRLNRLSIDALD